METMLTESYPEELHKSSLLSLDGSLSSLPNCGSELPRVLEGEDLLSRARSKNVLKINFSNIFKHVPHV